VADFADQLLAELDAATAWPLPRECEAHRAVLRGRALRKGEGEALKAMHTAWGVDRDYVPDPLAKRIAFGFADFLFADEVEITDSNEDEQAQAELDALVEANRMASGLHRTERCIISEGERYGKWHVNRAVAAVPLLTWSSRLTVVPLFYGERLLAAAFVTERAREMDRNPEGIYDSEMPAIVWRHAEIHTAGRVVNVLYRGDPDTLGVRKPLTEQAATAGYADEWVHGLPMLAFRVVNDLDDDDTLGVSEYEQVESLLLALNEAVTIASENARLTGQDRIFAAGKLRQIDGSFDASLQVYEVDTNPATTLGESPSNPSIYGVEKRYDAEPLWLHITSLVKTIVSRVGLVPQWIGQQVDGHGAAESGVARRLVFLPTTLAANGKIREWQDTLPGQLHNALRIIALPVPQGGFGRGQAPELPPTVEFTDPLPSDTGEVTLDVTTAVAGEVMSRRTAVRTLHPEWSEAQWDAELDEINNDIGGAAGAPPVA
jgi:hypothetical protein